jgi:hypothetical protein
MRFLRVLKPSKPEGAPPTQEEIAKMGKFVEEGFKSGVLLACEGCLPSAQGARVRLSEDSFTRDGRTLHRNEGADRWLRHDPGEFEGRGHGIYQDLLKVAGDGVSEIRQVCDAADPTRAKT